jgi:hypothetical protein
MTQAVNFFATAQDLRALLDLVGSLEDVSYTAAGSVRERTDRKTFSAKELPNLGISLEGATVKEPDYLVVRAGTPIADMELLGVPGGVRYILTQLENPESITCTLGGRYGNDCLIAGRVATISKDEQSASLYRVFARSIRKQFKRIKSFWLGPEAHSLWVAGCRLTTDVSGSRAYDLTA